MYNLQKNILDISKNHFNYLMNLQNVSAIGLGLKYINNINIFEPCLHVLVDKKLPSNSLTSNNIVPKNYMGIKTDVIEIGNLRFSSNDGLITQKFRPLESGCQLVIYTQVNNKPYEITGTLGCIVSSVINRKRHHFILSNNHVLANFNETPIGEEIMQLNYSDEEIFDEDVVAHLTNFIPLNPTKNNTTHINYVDCAIAKVAHKSLISNKVFNVGEITGVSKAILNEDVKKVGYYTGLTTGKILTLGATFNMYDSNNKKFIFKEQIIGKVKSDTGDSGSILLNNKNEAIGLIFGNSKNGTHILVNDINMVLKKLNVEIYTGEIFV